MVGAGAFTLLAACYRLTPVDATSPPTGMDVRLTLSDAGAVAMAPLIGPRIEAVEGRVLQAPDSAYVLAVQSVIARGGRTMTWSQERLSIPRTAVASVRTRTLDRKRTWLAAGLTVVGALALGEAFGLGSGFDGFFGSGGGGGGGKK